MAVKLKDSARQFLNEHQQELIDLIYKMCAIPSPSHKEEKRAAFIKGWLEGVGAEGVYIDDAQNVVYPYGDCSKDLVIVCAHTDTVFPDLEPMPLSVEGDIARCPGIGDNTTNLAVVMLLAKYCAIHKPKTSFGIVFAGNSGEEGLGNLKGVRKLWDDFGPKMREFISIDGCYSGIYNMAVGSTRYEVELKTEGGHSYGAFGNKNAIDHLGRIVRDIYSIQVPKRGGSKTTYNVGTISGGTSVNTIAQGAKMLCEYRSDSAECLSIMKGFFEKAFEDSKGRGCEVNVTVVGQRPCMGDVDPKQQEALSLRAYEIIEKVTGSAPEYSSGSTDCNIPLSHGVPSISFGSYIGGGAHTREEWIQISSLKKGFEAVMTFLHGYFA